MNLIRYKNWSIIVHFLLVTWFEYAYSIWSWQLYIAPFCHALMNIFPSAISKQITSMGRKQQKRRHSDFPDPNICTECSIRKWIRMRHCHKCQSCIHKYDHHCILLDVCIGQFNHKYYLIFLITHSFNTLIYIQTYLHLLQGQVSMDEGGVDHLSWAYFGYAFILMILITNALLICYLTSFHLYLVVFNETTYQIYRRQFISYFKSIDPEITHPFSKGWFKNLEMLFLANAQNPNPWKLKKVEIQLTTTSC